MAANMKIAVSRKMRIAIGVAVSIGVFALLVLYLSTTRLEVRITSRFMAQVFVAVVLIVLVVLPVYSVVVTREIRKRKRMEKALIRAKEEAERASQFKDRFLSTMSHELRTPLNAVLGFSDLLADKRYGELNERQQRYVGHIVSGGKHLLRLINDILDLSRIEAGRMEIVPEDLQVVDVFGEVIGALRPLVEKKSQNLSAHAAPGLGVRADGMRFRQVLMNLVGNAIKFTPEGGNIELSARKEGASVQIKVRDNGPGIAKEDQQRIFDAFYRLRESGEAVEGTGLGLAITESLVKLHGGSLGLDSEPGRGSCFYFSLPVSAAVHDSRDLVTGRARPGGAPPKILIIEDDVTTVQLIQSQLTSSGYEVACCDEPERAIETAAKLQPQAITLDLIMKPKSGWEVLLQLKQDPRTANIPVIVVTILDHPLMGATLGADEYLVKPVDKATLLAAVERCLARRGVSRPAPPILVVEDDPPTREIIVDSLIASGHTVATAADGESARAQVLSFLPELVILDLILPKVSGFELLEEWRADLRTADIPVFVVTNKELTAKEKKYIQAHAEALFHKQQAWQDALVRQVQRVISKTRVKA